MPSEWDGTPWGGTAPPAKVEIGPFVSRVQYGTPLAALDRSPQRKIRARRNPIAAKYNRSLWNIAVL